MKTTETTQVPDEHRELIGNLRISDENEPKGHPTLSPDQAGPAREWLTRILVETEALFAHFELLEKLYGVEFHYPLPRWCWIEGVPPPPYEPPAGFRHYQVLPEAATMAIVQHGLDAKGETGDPILTPCRLASLLLNPVALWDLSDRIHYLLPNSWLDRMDRVGREVMERYGLEITIPGEDEAAQE